MLCGPPPRYESVLQATHPLTRKGSANLPPKPPPQLSIDMDTPFAELEKAKRAQIAAQRKVEIFGKNTAMRRPENRTALGWQTNVSHITESTFEETVEALAARYRTRITRKLPKSDVTCPSSWVNWDGNGLAYPRIGYISDRFQTSFRPVSWRMHSP